MAFNGYIQVPPDSTGKKVGHVTIIEVDYTGGTIDFVIGDTVTGATSGLTGTVIKVDGTTAAGEVYLALTGESPIATTNGENLRVEGVTYAQASGTGAPWYNPTVTIVDHENAFRGVNVTSDGEMLMSPAEGPFGFDSFGNLSVSQENYLGLYHYEYGIDYGLMNPQTSSLGLGETILPPSIVNNLAWSGIQMTNPATSGSVTRLESHLYHPYNAGTGMKWIGSINFGDAGTNGVVRRWGYFDNEDGIFFELSQSIINVVVRSSVSGVVTENRIPQSQWNVDRVNGQGGDFNISELDLDVSKGRVYFMDLQWLGVGRVRWGIIGRGKKVVCHQIFHGGTVSYPYMRTAVLPVRIEQVNYGTAGGPVVMRNYSMAVIAASRGSPFSEQVVGQTQELTKTVDWTGSFRPLFSVRSKQLFQGRENRAIAIPTELQVYSEGAPVVIQVHKWARLTGDTWTVPTSSYNTLMGDSGATTASFGVVQYSAIIPPNQMLNKVFPLEWNDAWKIHRKENIADDQCAFTVMGKLLNTRTAPSSSVSITLNWKEIY